MAETDCDIGMIGLGVMGRNLLLNLADHGYGVAGFDTDPAKVEALRAEGGARRVCAAASLEAFIGALREPRKIMMLVPAGPPVDNVIAGLLPHLQRGDIVIDGGNSYFKDTDLRRNMLAERGISYLGLGISGGERGARSGPSIMPGGCKKAYERVRALFESVAARAEGQPCIAYMGPGSAGHYVKMVHNGIEYGLMQLIAETYDLMKRGLGLSDGRYHDVFAEWNRGDLESFLLEITSHIFCEIDDVTGKRLVDLILDTAEQKGTGRWSAQDAMTLGVPVPTLGVAVTMRNLSAMKDERVTASEMLGVPAHRYEGDAGAFLEALRHALYCSFVVSYAQGMALLREASVQYKYELDFEEIARTWRGGCIIRSAIVERIRQAFARQGDLENIMLDPDLAGELRRREQDWRFVVATAARLGIPAAAMMASLGYFDAFRSAWLPANLIQAQRDYFGAHTFERVDAEGAFHSHWEDRCA